MKNHLRFRNHQGFTLVEVLIAFVVMSFLSLTTLTFIDSVRTAEAKQETLTYRNNEASQFFSQLAQPGYVGALAAYAENKKLLQCLEEDNVLCKVGEEYPLVAFDLVTGKPIVNLDTGSESYVGTRLSFTVHCPQNASSCDKIDYINIKISTKTNSKWGVSLQDEKVVTVEPNKTTFIPIIPDTETKSGSPANILIFVDGSNSMSTIKDSFKTSLENLLEKVKTMDATVGVYSLNTHVTPTPAGAYYFEADGVTKTYTTNWRIVPPGTIIHSVSELRLTYTDDQTFFKFEHDMTPAQRDANIKAINTQIDSIFKSAAVTRDASLCGFMRALQDVVDGKSSFKITDGTPTLVMILTNEDDESVLANVGEDLDNGLYKGWYSDESFVCARSIVQKWEKDPAQRFYKGKQSYYSFTATADFSMDGIPTTVSVPAQKFTVNYSTAFKEGDSCLSEMKSFKPTVDSMLKWLTTDRSLYPGATYLNKYTITDCKIVYQTDEVASGSTATNECNGKYSPENLPTLVPGTCTYEDLPSTKTSVTDRGAFVNEVYAPTNTKAHETRDITLVIHDLLKSNFKIGNFSFVAVINPSSGACPLTPGASYGTTYEKLAAFPDINSDIIPICSSTYDSKLVESSEFLKSFSLGTIKAPISSGPRIKGVDILRGSQIINPTKGADYTIAGDVINFTTGYLQATDVVRVYFK